jgi:Flp pilus assembly pilin Flp
MFLRPAQNKVRVRRGATAVEYAVMLSLIIILCLVVINLLGQGHLRRWFESLVDFVKGLFS